MMTDRSNQDMEGYLRDLIRDECQYFGSMMGQVTSTDDELGLGRIQVIIPFIGRVTQQDALWIAGRDKQMINVPIVGDWVEVRFMDGHRDRGYYCGICNQVESQKLKNFDGQRTTHILIEDPTDSSQYIKYDEVKKELDILVNMIKLQGGSEAFVLGGQLNTFLTNMVTTINGALGGKLDGGGTAGTLTPPSGILSTTIMGK
jgi:hypothetical protein